MLVRAGIWLEPLGVVPVPVIVYVCELTSIQREHVAVEAMPVPISVGSECDDLSGHSAASLDVAALAPYMHGL